MGDETRAGTDSTPAAGPGWRAVAVAAVFYTACVAVATFPAALHLRDALPSRIDPMQHLWVMRWYKTCLFEGRSPFHCPELQYPVGAALGNFSPLHLQSLLYLIVSAFTDNDILCFNLIWWAGFVFTGLGTFLLAWHVLRDRTCATVAGMLAMLSTPMLIHSRGHLELIHVGGFPLFLLAWVRFVDRPSAGRLTAAVASYLLLSMSAAYFTVFAVFPAALYAAWETAKAFRRGERSWLRVRLGWWAAFCALAGALLLPIFWPQIWAKAHGFSMARPRSEFDRFGASLWGYVLPTSHHRLGGLLPADPYEATEALGENISYLGVVTFFLIHQAALRRSRFPRSGYWWTCLVALVVLSMGSHLQYGDRRFELPAAWLWNAFPPVRMLRVPARLNLFAGVVAALIAGAGLKSFLGRCRSAGSRRSAAALVAVLALFDLSYINYPNAPLPRMPACYAFLKQRDPSATLVEIPQLSSGGAHLLTAASGYWQAIHRLPTTAGYSGASNVRFDDLMTWSSPFAASSLARPGYARSEGGDRQDLSPAVDFDGYAWLYLKAHKLRYVVVHQWPGAVFEVPIRLDALKARMRPALVFEDADAAVYDSTLLPEPRRAVLLCNGGWRQRVPGPESSASAVGRVAKVSVFNPHPDRDLSLTIAAAGKSPHEVTLTAGGKALARWSVTPGAPKTYVSPPFRLGRGVSELAVESDGEDTPARPREVVAEGDTRPYSLKVVGVSLGPPVEISPAVAGRGREIR